MKINDFLDQSTSQKAGVIEVRNKASALVTSLVYDSREVKPHSMFFALPGFHTDGHSFIPDAIEKGAVAVVHQQELTEYRDDIFYIRVKDSRFAMSPIADAFFGHPSQKMVVIGVTGTEGKSTTVYLIYQLLKLLGKKAGFISTVQQCDGITEKWNSEHQTTPEAVVLHRLLDEMYKNGAEYVVLESSSHGLSKKTNRLGDVAFDVGVMTNVNHEHLEFHGSWEQYRSDKAELFRALDNSTGEKSFGVANAADKSAAYFAAATLQKTYFYDVTGDDTDEKADLYLKAIESVTSGNSYEVCDKFRGKIIKIKDQLPGAFNADNTLAALLVVSNLFDIKIEDLAGFVPQLKPVRGRMTLVSCGQPFEVLVDYAHSPTAFEMVIPPLRKQLASTRPNGRLISLFGSAGERDTKKRGLQGAIAAAHSDIVILSDEDPRGEDSMTILEEIAQACTNLTKDESLFLIPDRPKAIRKAFSLARPGDLVLLLGKGHENSIIYAKEAIPYDEISEAEAALGEMGYGG